MLLNTSKHLPKIARSVYKSVYPYNNFSKTQMLLSTSKTFQKLPEASLTCLELF